MLLSTATKRLAKALNDAAPKGARIVSLGSDWAAMSTLGVSCRPDDFHVSFAKSLSKAIRRARLVRFVSPDDVDGSWCFGGPIIVRGIERYDMVKGALWRFDVCGLPD